MKFLHISIVLLQSAFVTVAQEPADTVATQQLREIVIQAPKVIHKADMDIYHPSKSAVDLSLIHI